MLRIAVERHPHDVALVYYARQWTYAEWFGRIERVAAALAQLGVARGDRVALYLPNSEMFATSYFACQILGAVAVPMSIRLSNAEVLHIVRDSGARVLVYGPQLMDNSLTVEERVNSLHDLVSCADNREDVPDGHLHFESLATGALAVRPVLPSFHPSDMSAIVYTSGTTGHPKGVVHTHANDVAIAMNCVMEYRVHNFDKALHVAPLYHVGGMQAFLIPHVFAGAQNVILESYDTADTLDAIQDLAITTLFAVPTMLGEMLSCLDLQDRDLSSLRLVTTGGAALTGSMMEKVAENICPNVYHGYGMTEASLALVLHPRDAIRKRGSCGKPSLITECRLVGVDDDVHTESSSYLVRRERGELMIKGPQVTSSYWNLPNVTATKLKDGWLYTGDVFTRDTDGFYFFEGRHDDMIVSGGENIYPIEIENALLEARCVRDVAVVGLPDEKWGQAVTAFVVRRHDDCDAASIEDDILANESVARHKRPKRYIFVESLPRNENGKVVKSALMRFYVESET